MSRAAESGGEAFGHTASTRSFDFNFDGNEDLLLGYNYVTPWAPPSEAVFLAGAGDGTFAAPVLVRDFPNDSYAKSLKIPQRLCRRFSIGP